MQVANDEGRSELWVAIVFLALALGVPLGLGFLIQDNLDSLSPLLNQGLEQVIIVGDLALLVIALYVLSDKIFPPGVPPPEVLLDEDVPIVPAGTPPTTEKPPEPPPTHWDEHGPGCVVRASWKLAMMDMTLYPNNRVIGSIYKYSKTTKAGAYRFALPYHRNFPLRVESTDYHTLVQECSCPGIAGDLGRKTFTLPAKTKVQWQIVEGEGEFVQVSRGDGSNSDVGDEVIFDPPDIYKPEPDFDPPDVKKVRIRVTVFHDDPTKPPDHDSITSFIVMEIRRVQEKGGVGEPPKKDEYVVDYWVEEASALVGPEVPETQGDCLPEHTWSPGTPIDGKITLLPAKAAPGDLVRVEAFGKDVDQLELRCVPSGKACKLPGSLELTLNDNLSYFWQCSAGEFPLGGLHDGDRTHDLAREAVWRAPDAPGAVTFRLLISDSSRQYSDKAVHLEGQLMVEGGKVPPVTPPPVTPPPEVIKKKEREECKVEEEEHDSHFNDQVDVSRWWDEDREIEEAIKKSVEERHSWNTDDVGTAVAISDGASVGGSACAGAKVHILEGTQTKLKRTEKLEAQAKGSTEVEISIEAPRDAKTAISAAAIGALDAQASVLDVPEWLYELVEWEGRGAGTAEAGEQLYDRKEIVHLIKEIWKQMKEGGVKAGQAAEGAALVAARLIEELGKRLLLNGEVDVGAEGEMSLKVGSCVTDGGAIGVGVSRAFEMVNGEIEEPHDGEFESQDLKFTRSSCSADRNLKVEIESEVKVDGKAEDGGEGKAILNSIWAVAWVAGCEHGEMGGVDFERDSYYGCRFGGWFTLPQEKLDEYHEDDAANLRHMVENLFSAKLKEMLRQANITSPLDDRKAAEAELKEVLDDWMNYVRDEWGLFTKE